MKTRADAAISVIIPVHNREALLPETLASVWAQTLAPAEVIVVDDGSTDNSVRVAKRWRPHVRVASQSQQGPGAARNAGIALASGDLLAFVDSDDLWPEDKLEKQAAVLAERPELDMVFGAVEQFADPDVTERGGAFDPTAASMAPHVGTLVARRHCFERAGSFNPKWKNGEFIDWFGRAQDAGLRHEVLPCRLLRRRIHAGNLMRQTGDELDYARILKAAIDRRRG